MSTSLPTGSPTARGARCSSSRRSPTSSRTAASTRVRPASSREHAAMEPRYMGCKAVLVRSFARIHEANLKKQGILPLTFANTDDYERVQFDDTVDVVGLSKLAPGDPVTVVLHHSDGTTDE